MQKMAKIGKNVVKKEKDNIHPWRADVLSIEPSFFPGPLASSISGKAMKKGLWSLRVTDIRDFADGRHACVDAIPYGGGAGMIMRPDVVGRAIESLYAPADSSGNAPDDLSGNAPADSSADLSGNAPDNVSADSSDNASDNASADSSGNAPDDLSADSPDDCGTYPDKSDHRPIIYLSPRGRPLNQDMVTDLAARDGVILICARFEGMDQRVIDHYRIDEISLGDYILSGGEIAALAVIDACVRLLPGVVGSAASLEDESFSRGLLEYPHYTRPRLWKNLKPPSILLGGHHENVRQWRRRQSECLTKSRRPDLWASYQDRKNKEKP